ncbi:MAG: tyrosine-type recombinase/integrase [Cyanomargarita calcarea GSE-NOS-MK-12-04C]|uniref:Tyrosine-type recombinase/integrase n=1 Tax=Cyanomargarita calcarea GSE-NOS-MK-12-04C TaxID=2839659 RepID=A0A951URU3_9CYAN|nr:tyrosine-type recombinase/integrase [Cyanomargarita calcarea GSE-NOS-MK-12-04C]
MQRSLTTILFLYKEVLKQDLDLKVDAVRAKKSKYLPTVLTKDEVLSIIQKLSGVHQLLIKLLYGTGLRLNEALSLRVKDVDFALSLIYSFNQISLLPQEIALGIHQT